MSKGNRIVYNEKTKEAEQQSKGAYFIAINLKNNEIKYSDLRTDGINLNSCFVTNGKIHFNLNPLYALENLLEAEKPAK